jgi:hypothetical protein
MPRLMVLLLLMGLCWPFAARADDPLAELASGNFSSVRQGVQDLALSGDPHAATIISALQNSKLYYMPDGTLLIKADDDSFTNAATGESFADSDDEAKAVRVNNSVRGAIDAALGSLRLFDKDASVRLDAAEAVFNAHDPASIPALDRALAQEPDASVKRRMQQARAAAVIADPEGAEKERLAAVAELRDRGDQASRSLLSSLAGQTGPVADAAAAAVVSIDWVLQLWSVGESAFYGISLGSVLLLAAAGLAITFGVMGVINMAHGEMVMIGAYTTFVVQQLMHAYLPALYEIEKSRMRTRPPGWRTRDISFNPASQEAMLRSPKAAVTVPKVPSGKGRCCPSASTSSLTPRRRATSSMGRQKSAPTTRHPGKFTLIAEARSPLPVATSRTRLGCQGRIMRTATDLQYQSRPPLRR